MMHMIGVLLLVSVLVSGIYLYSRTCSIEREILEIIAAKRAGAAGPEDGGVEAGGRADG